MPSTSHFHALCGATLSLSVATLFGATVGCTRSPEGTPDAQAISEFRSVHREKVDWNALARSVRLTGAALAESPERKVEFVRASEHARPTPEPLRIAAILSSAVELVRPTNLPWSTDRETESVFDAIERMAQLTPPGASFPPERLSHDASSVAGDAISETADREAGSLWEEAGLAPAGDGASDALLPAVEELGNWAAAPLADGADDPSEAAPVESLKQDVGAVEPAAPSLQSFAAGIGYDVPDLPSFVESRPTAEAVRADEIQNQDEVDYGKQDVEAPFGLGDGPVVAAPVPQFVSPLPLVSPAPSTEASFLETLAREATPVTTGELTAARVDEKATELIRRAAALAERGAQFAARVQLLGALRVLSQAADKRQGEARRTSALVNGLRAMDEAADFYARGAVLDAELDVSAIASAHRTPVAREAEIVELMPQQAADLYYRYSQKRLGEAIQGSAAGSMALYSLGKLYSQLGATEPESYPDAQRRAFAFQQAALIARPDNDMAAHELGVLMAEAGHLAEAENLLSQVASRQPHPVVVKNLANVQRRLGWEQAAVASELYAAELSATRTEEGPVAWMNPVDFAQTSKGTNGASPWR